MAIDFSCPLCRAVLRAPAGAAGRLGDCPHCEGELAVPGAEVAAADRRGRLFVPVGVPLDAGQVAAAADGQPVPRTAAPTVAAATPAAASSSDTDAIRDAAADAVTVPPPVEFAEEADGDAVVLTAVDDDAAVGTPVDDTAAAVPAPAPTRPRRSRSRRRGVPWGAVLMLLVIAGVTGGAGWVLYQRLAPQSAAVAGTLVGRPVDAADVPPATLLAPAGADPAAVRAMAGGLPMRSPVVEVELRATGDEEVAVTVGPGTATRLVSVRLADEPGVRAWLEDTEAVYTAKRSELTAARGAFFAAVAEAAASDAPPEVAPYRDTVALNAATEELGWAVEAVADGRAYPAVRETGDGAVIFAVPRGTDTFTVRGRDLPGAGRAFGLVYEVAVREDGVGETPG